MNKVGISTEQNMLGVGIGSIMTESSSVSTFLPEEDTSICPLLSTTPSPPLAFSHPLTPSADNDSNNSVNGEDTKAETSSSGSSSGIGMDATDTAAQTLFNGLGHAYHHLRKNADNGQENGHGHKSNGHLNIKQNKDTPSFVSWNWPLIRKCTFFIFLASMFAMCAIVVGMIVTLPKTCNPRTAWFRGSVFYEIFPASFQDSNNDGVGDLRGIAARVDYFEELGIGAIRLNSIYQSKEYPDDFENITSLTDIYSGLGTDQDLADLANSLHARNISLILDFPLYPFFKQLDPASSLSPFDMENSTTIIATTKLSLEFQNSATEAMRKWLALGIDGFFIKGLKHFIHDPNFLDNIAEWKFLLGENRVLIVSSEIFENLDSVESEKILKNVDLVDVHLNVSNGTRHMENAIKSTLKSIIAPSEFGPWIQWSIGGVSKQRISRMLIPNATLAATVMQLMLPGTPNIFYGDEIALDEAHDPHNEHEDTKHLHHLSTMQWNNGLQFTNRETLPWLPRGASASFENYEIISKMINLREVSPSIYKNTIQKNHQNLPNTNIRHSQDDILVVERIYPRRNTFVSISNFGTNRVSMDMTSMYYSGHVMLGKTRKEKIYFGQFEIGPMETIVVRLDK